jgi:type IV secretion system protein VirB9
MGQPTRTIIMTLSNCSRSALKTLVVAGAIQGALLSAAVHAEMVPTRGVADSRIRYAPYNDDQVYRVRGVVGYQIDFEFEAGETFVGLGAGDLEGISYFGTENHLFLKPKAAKVATNLTVLTSRRRYQIDYEAATQRPRPGDPDVMFAVRFTYARTSARTQAEQAAERIDTALTDASAKRPRNIDYWYCGSPTLKPVAASDDGVHTRLRFAANAELPAIFVRNADGIESLLNFSMDSGDVVVHRVARQFILRRGRLAGCVVNQGFTGAGLRLDSGTVAPDVRRAVPGVVP